VLKAHDGTVIHAQLAASPLEVEAGNSICLVVNDLTELEASARSIAVLRKHQQELEQNEHTLRLTADALARSNRDLEQFAYIASHDLQEPLRQVKAFVQMLQGRLADKLDAKCKQYLEFIRQGAARMSALVQDLLVYSRVGGGEMKQEPASCQVALSVAMTDLEGRIAEAHAKIAHDELPIVSGDKTQLVQLFENLLSNAIKFRRDGVPPEIHVGAQRDGHQWRLWVKDNGIGIDPPYHDKLFLLFQRLNGQQEHEGTGIGLAICKKIIERHGGRIWIDSKPGEGSTFYFTLLEDRPA
jgi:light-regulated signal transduction histidine kinase (bacteriophytochrome)